MTASVDWRTPALSVIDGRGLPIAQVAYLRRIAGVAAERQISRQIHDTAGRSIEQWDARLPVPCLATAHSLSGTALKTASVDAGWRLSLPGLAGEPLQRWDQRGTHWRTTFDKQLRVIALAENDEADVDVFTYADASADAAHNLRGQLLAQQERAGTLRTGSFALTGQPLTQTRTFEEGQAFTSHWLFSPLGAALEQTDAGGHRQRSGFGLAGQLKQVHLRINGKTEWQPVVLDVLYNAAGQIIEQLAGNHVRNRWTYHLADGRLHTQSSRNAAGEVLQDFEYFHDPVGNISRIEDHAFQPVYFANQRVDGHRDFTYDSLYRLARATGYDDAPPSDIPGLPQPGDPNNRLNYTQTYQYDAGNNLIELKHVRAGASHTCQMRIDPNSNRGVRWHPGDPLPDFDSLFDRHGNQQNLQTVQDLQWNARDELQRVTLIARGGTRDDAEHYRYSQGVRVFKRHETFTDNAAHFHQVRYLPGLEIRSKDNGEELHVISLGNARCLHWAENKPDGVDDDQLRYSLDDHLGSCVMELDQAAQLISHEGYYPFGATAWMAEKSATTVSYKFIRYSGKEMDVSGLYYYGARYYAPWLQRWVSADPAGAVDGLNLYGFVGNNPLRYFDDGGTTKTPSEQKKIIDQERKFLSVIPGSMRDVQKALGDLTSPASFRQKILTNLLYLSGRAIIGFAAGYNTTSTLPASIPGELQGLTLGNASADAVNPVFAKVASSLNQSILPRQSDLDVQSLRAQSAGSSASPLESYSVSPATWQERSENIRALFSFGRDGVGGALLPGVSELAELFKVSKDATKAEQLLTRFEMDAYESMFDSLRDAIIRSSKAGHAALDALGVEQVYANSADYLMDLAQGRVAAPNSRMVSRSTINTDTESALSSVEYARSILGRYRTYVAQQTLKRAA
ncbi:RHS repeat-associated core domain-containing protein [Pseudomonas sp.]|uniref:RHS repeat-associated core domain-containing protein n=1 Tax=Pseudomonas sp. TaxID=306 RepID=UPI003BB4DE91